MKKFTMPGWLNFAESEQIDEEIAGVSQILKTLTEQVMR